MCGHGKAARVAGMKLNEIAGYTPVDWQADRDAEGRGDVLRCPNCEHANWYHPVGIPPDSGAERKYRACKVCGFWQEADGKPAYRCWMTVHTCLGSLAEGARCQFCGAWGPRTWHAGCWRILPSRELGVTTCPNCGVILTPGHVVPWPVIAE